MRACERENSKTQRLQLGIQRRLAMPFVLRPVFSPPFLVEKLGKVFTDVLKFVLRQGAKSLLPPRPLCPPLGISSFISSLDERCQCRQILYFAATLASTSQIVIDRLSFGF
ncbi:hypothetical protein AVEN_7385-1 [Araneus ventricosus]|uniref:Uncharacterized protein n=1 Tax=Araneus ventricosus TaxID=182803 RepID=A0A4Y2BRY0_ARAVE|nr:hypothetical protein AVEN_7385-1 [Araneus ventricosus]